MRVPLAVTLVVFGVIGSEPTVAEAAVYTYHSFAPAPAALYGWHWTSNGGAAGVASTGPIFPVEDGIYSDAVLSNGRVDRVLALSGFTGGPHTIMDVRRSLDGYGRADASSVITHGTNRVCGPDDPVYKDPDGIIYGVPGTEPIPEPGTLVLFGFGLATATAARLRKRRKRS